MVQASNRLGARSISTIKQPGLHADGNGLYLKVKPTGTKSWAYVFFLNGKRSLMGLGSASEVSLAEARDRRDEMRALVKRGIDPRGEKKASAAKGDAANAIEDTGRTDLFSNVAKALIEDLRPGWKSAKHGQQWTNTLEQHAGLIWDMPVADITVNHVMNVLRPIWITKSETATRVRSRIERVLAVAKSRGLRTGDNPAVWKENLEFMMAKRPTGQRGHHAAMPYQDVPEFMKELRTRPAMAARLLEWTILTCVRTGEAMLARRHEVDVENKIWTIPAIRMKGTIDRKEDHRVPLCDRALEILAYTGFFDDSPDAYIFPTDRRDPSGHTKPMSNMVMKMLLRRMDLGKYTPHGFRSSFRDWAEEATDFDTRLAEMCLAHTVGNAVERAYRRSDVLDKRRKLMEAWSNYALSECVSGDG